MLIANKYRLESVLGEGGFGTVYLARHIRLQRNAERVVKLIKPEVFSYDGMEKRFYREVQVTSDLSQRNEHIVRIYDDFGDQTNLGHFYVMEYLQGRPLLDYIEDPNQPPDLRWSFSIFRQLCDAMQAAHEEEIIHRDLKPENILLIPRRKHPFFVKVLDFGIAKPMQSQPESTKLTQGALGTPYYMSPEQTVNKAIDARSDMYSMGIMLFELLTGRHPFIPAERETNISAMELMSAHMMQDMPNATALYPNRAIPEGVSQAILRATAKKPEERFGSVEEFWHHVERAAGALAQARPEELTAMVPEHLRTKPSEHLKKQTANAFAQTAGHGNLDSGSGLASMSGPRSTPTGFAHSGAGGPLATGTPIQSTSSGSLPSGIQSQSSPNMPTEAPKKKRGIVFWLLIVIGLSGMGLGGIFLYEMFETTTAPPPFPRIDNRPQTLRNKPVKARTTPTKQPSGVDVDSKFLQGAPAGSIKLPDTPDPRKKPAIRRPKPAIRKPSVRKRRVKKRRRRASRKRPVARRPAGNACPKKGWVRLLIRPCSQGAGQVKVHGKGIRGLRGTSVCVPARRTISIEQPRCAACIFSVPKRTSMTLVLKNASDVDIDTGKTCLSGSK
jgi:serine/threonine-protein kinase